MSFKLSICALLAVTVAAFAPVSPAGARSSIRVGLADQSAQMFAAPDFQKLNIKRTRYFVPSDVMQNSAERAKARAFVLAARGAGVSTLLHISTTDLRQNHGKLVSTTAYRSNVGRIVVYFRALGVRDFGSWDEVNHKTQETWNHVGNAVSYFESMYRAVKGRCKSCAVVGLDVLDQAGVQNYIKSFYNRLSSTWRKRLSIVGIHNYSDVNRNRSSGTSTIISTVRRYNRSARYWFTETGALASFQGSFPYSEPRQAARVSNVFKLASQFKSRRVDRVYYYNWFGAESGPSCASSCLFDSGLVRPDGGLRPAYATFTSKIKNYSR